MPDSRDASDLYATFSEYAAKRWEREDWSSFGRETGTSDVLNGHARLYRSLNFGDDDYPDAVWSVVPQLLPAAAASKGLPEQMQVVADAVPDLPDWASGSDSSLRTRKRFAEFLVRNSDVLPSEWRPHALTATLDPASAEPTTRGVPPVRRRRPASVVKATDGAVALSTSPAGSSLPAAEPNIFVVHGHDVTAVREIQVFVHSVAGVMPVSLADEPGRGDTIIEKFERRANAATFAIVLLTPDDLGSAAGAAELQPRARQNVVLELGYFIAKLGRDRVAVINAGVERPSDIDGVSYIPYPSDNWKWALRQELKAAGLSSL